jgi:hypothetical protein
MRTQYLVAIVVVAVVGAALYFVVLGRVQVERPLAYWPVDDRTVEVVFLDAPGLDCGIASVEESIDAVRIHAQCAKAVLPLPQGGMAQKYVFRTTLQASLGSRAVFDGLGNQADRCQFPGEDCIAPG